MRRLPYVFTISVAAIVVSHAATSFTLAAEPSKAEPVTPENVVRPQANTAEEPRIETFSPEQAAHFLDSAALDWQNSRKCMACHTGYLYLMARPSLGTSNPAYEAVRQYAEELVETRWPDVGPRWDAEVVMTAGVLAYGDRTTGESLHATTRKALDHMWTLQRDDGGFDWLKCNWPPYESDDDFGVAMVALSTLVAPDDYAQTEAAQAGLSRIREYLTANPPPTLHHRGWLLWADSYQPGVLMNEKQRADVVEELLSLEQPEGGWALASLGNWERHDGAPQDRSAADGYGTAWSIYILRRAGVEAEHDAIRRGLAWLKENQRESGRWWTRSLYKDNHHFLTHAGTAWAILALDSCDALTPAQTAAK